MAYQYLNKIEKLERHIQLMENGEFTKINDFQAFLNERKEWADSFGSWACHAIWPINLLCPECEQRFELNLSDLNSSHVDISGLRHTGHPTIAHFPVIIGCKSCGIENVYNLTREDAD